MQSESCSESSENSSFLDRISGFNFDGDSGQRIFCPGEGPTDSKNATQDSPDLARGHQLVEIISRLKRARVHTKKKLIRMKQEYSEQTSKLRESFESELAEARLEYLAEIRKLTLSQECANMQLNQKIDSQGLDLEATRLIKDRLTKTLSAADDRILALRRELESRNNYIETLHQRMKEFRVPPINGGDKSIPSSFPLLSSFWAK